MKEEWERKYRAAFTEHNPALKWRRILEAREAIVRRTRETEATPNEREKLGNAIGVLNLLSNR
jgi:hypothetical protein